MNKIALAIHGGAGPDSDYIKQNMDEYRAALEAALNAGYAVLEKGGHALDAVEAAVNAMEDNPLFNAGRGSSLNEKAEVEMNASIMSGYDQSAGAVATIKNVRNPISLARAVMEKTNHIYLCAEGAMEFARAMAMPMEPDAYFVTEHAFAEYQKARDERKGGGGQLVAMEQTKKHGTVGAVALDAKGNLAAGTSTGGLEFAQAGRVADSSMIGIGSYANNGTCAVSTTGEGEFHIQHVTAFHISALVEYGKMSLADACRYLIHEKCKHVTADMGLIAVDPEGNLVAEFNTQRMHRGLKSSEGVMVIEIYP